MGDVIALKSCPSFITVQVYIGGNTIAFENSAINCCWHSLVKLFFTLVYFD